MLHGTIGLFVAGKVQRFPQS